MAKNKEELVFIQTPKGRVSFPYVFKKSKNDKYEMTLIFPEGTDLGPLKALAKKAVLARWGKIPKPFRWPFRRCSDKPIYAKEYGPKDIFVTFRSKNIKPIVVNRKREAAEEAEFYPGCWAWCKCNVYTYTEGGTPGISFGMGSVQKVGEDDPFGGMGASNPEDDFEVLDDEDSEVDYEDGDDDFFSDDEDGEAEPWE